MFSVSSIFANSPIVAPYDKSPVIFMVAGEASGDIVGARLLQALKLRYPHMRFVGVGGEQMQAAGLESLYPMSILSVMGLIAPLCRLPQILRVFYGILKQCKQLKPVLFIGIDSPDFNLRLEARLKQQGIKTMHVVGPSVWAWRQGRIHAIRRAVDHMCVLFPFETVIYEQHGIPVTCIGHPSAQQFPLISTPAEKTKARKQLGMTANELVIALLPGSRKSDLKYLLPLLLEAAVALSARYPHCQFVLPCATPVLQAQVSAQLAHYPALRLTLLSGETRLAMEACDLMLVKSGTATLEGLFCKKKMIVLYRLSTVAYWFAKKLVKLTYVSLPNLLTQEPLVPELIQDKATVPQILAAVETLLQEPVALTEARVLQFTQVHDTLRQDYADKIVSVVERMVC